MKVTTALATAVILMASVAAVAPAYADEDSDLAPARVQRSWNGGNASGGQHTTANRGTAAGHTTRGNGQAAAPTRPAVTSNDDDDSDGARVTGRGNRGGGNSYRGHDSQFDLDPAEAARIREAHRQADHHVTLRRDDDGDVPYYYTPRRRHWYSWW